VPEDERASRIEHNPDICIIDHPEQTDHFIRTSLNQAIKNDHRVVNYGVWVSLSQSNFEDYIVHFGEDDHEAKYFGYLSNMIPDYPSTLNIPMTVVVRPGGLRPLVYPHDDHEHMFVHDFNAGISLVEAERRVAWMMG
jgi:hypothetical protein